MKNKDPTLCRYYYYYYYYARITLTITLLSIFQSKNVTCQNDYYEEVVNTATANGGEEMLIHSSVNNAISTKLDSLDVICGKEYMTVRAEFNGPFNGIIFSKGTYGQSKCVYVKPHSGLTHATFNVRYDECGTKPDLQGKYFENTIVIQYGTDIIEAYDEAKRLRCEWFEAYEKPATFRPAIPVADLDIIEMNFQGDEIDCWMSIQEGKGPWSNEINRIVTVGQPLTIVVAINDKKNQFDMKVKSCFAHDGIKPPIYLIDEDGCILRPKMISPFQKLRNLKGKASLISYAQFLAFKFPDSVDVQIQCTVEVCRHGCMTTCNDGSSSNLDHHRNNFHRESNIQIENVTSHHFMINKDDLLESANTNREPVSNSPIVEISTDENMPNIALVDDSSEKQNYLDMIADYLHKVENNKNSVQSDDKTAHNDYLVETNGISESSNIVHNNKYINNEHSSPNNHYQIEHKNQQKTKKVIPNYHRLHVPPLNNMVLHKKHVLREPVAQVMNIPLSPIYSMPLPLSMGLSPTHHYPSLPSKQNSFVSSGFSSLLNPFNSIKLFNKKHAYIPQLLSNYFNQKRQNVMNYVPNDNFEMLLNSAPPLSSSSLPGHIYRTKRYINNGKQGEIGLKKGFQVVTTLDLSFAPNISQDQMPVLEGKPEAVVYGICFSSIYFIYAIATTISLLFSGLCISIFIVFKLEKVKNKKNRC